MSCQEPGKRRWRRAPGAHSRRAIRRQDQGDKPWPRAHREPVTRLPDPGDAQRIAAFLDSHPGWSAFWDKRAGIWRVAEDDPDSGLYAEDADAAMVVRYMATHS
jgi:hypothetical protein